MVMLILSYSPSICLEGLKETSKTLCQDSEPLAQETNQDLANIEHEC
jgi:hypothetical protein